MNAKSRHYKAMAMVRNAVLCAAETTALERYGAEEEKGAWV